MRVCTIDYLITESKLDNMFFDTLIQKTIEKDKNLTKENQKQYINSLLHRERFRLWQFVLILLPRLNKVS